MTSGRFCAQTSGGQIQRRHLGAGTPFVVLLHHSPDNFAGFNVVITSLPQQDQSSIAMMTGSPADQAVLYTFMSQHGSKAVMDCGFIFEKAIAVHAQTEEGALGKVVSQS